ncbi:hypothetical protein [Actinokineospora sp.]|uniref:hypothetical protein n=1 Tax=Actinokineospora sp. TaxID=1872133 RepID=UPI00403836A2
MSVHDLRGAVEEVKRLIGEAIGGMDTVALQLEEAVAVLAIALDSSTRTEANAARATLQQAAASVSNAHEAAGAAVRAATQFSASQ